MTTTTKAAPISKAEMRLNELAQRDAYLAAKQVERDNKRFEKASPAAKRVIIAKDVLKWLGEGKITPSPGTYLSDYLRDPTGQEYLRDPETNELVVGRKLDDRVNGGRCAACALGAVFACSVERLGGVYDFWNMSSNKMVAKLEPFFSGDQLRLIECAFEKFIDNPADPTGAAREFGERYDNPKPRMVAIMENIIANKGTFIP